MYEESDENYVQLDYTPTLIPTALLMNHRAMSRINYLPLSDLQERLGIEKENIALEDAQAEMNMLKEMPNETVKVEHEK